MPTPIAQPFSGTRLRALRERSGLTQDALAERLAALGISLNRSTIGQYERGAIKPTAPVFLGLARALEVEIDDLLEEGAA